jgi:ubiquinone/menaquinone biosynthesis C-methylase UbiE
MKWLEKFIDMTARRPSGWIGKKLYKNAPNHREGFELLKDKIKLQSHENVLEVGCGAGVLLEELLEKADHAAAIDHSQDMLQLAKVRNQHAIDKKRLTLKLGDVHTLPWPDNYFDAIASSHMFFFVEHPEKMLTEAYRVLKPNGRIVIVTMPPNKLARYLFFPYAKAMRCYDKKQMIALLTSSGFNNVEVNEISLMQLACAKKTIG